MSFDDLGLLLGVIEIRVVLHILVHGLQSLWCVVISSLIL
jgi:hypothetical protein